VIDVDLLAWTPANALVRSFAACLASVTETPLDELPLPDAHLPSALGLWRNWLAEHGAGHPSANSRQISAWPPGPWHAPTGSSSPKGWSSPGVVAAHGSVQRRPSTPQGMPPRISRTA
jgi:hypothetical protein